MQGGPGAKDRRACDPINYREHWLSNAAHEEEWAQVLLWQGELGFEPAFASPRIRVQVPDASSRTCSMRLCYSPPGLGHASSRTVRGQGRGTSCHAALANCRAFAACVWNTGGESKPPIPSLSLSLTVIR